jgi:hypothetical protein
MTAGQTVGINIFCNSASQDITVNGGPFAAGSEQGISMFSGFRIG